jgi:flavodoxin
MYQVIYHSMGGNTKKVAEAIGDVAGVSAESVKSASVNPAAGLIFLGSGCYGDKPGDDMAKFIQAQDFSGKTVALFGTSGAGAGKEVGVMAEAIRRKGAEVKGTYHCKGRAFFVVNIGKPDREDMEAARKFAREMIHSG